MDFPPEFQAVLDGLHRQIATLLAENAELRRRLGLDSSNSGKPPSSDGLKKKPRVAGSLRGVSGKPGGGQAGHKGDTLRQVQEVDVVSRHEAASCATCRAALDATMVVGVERRQVFDLPAPRLEVTEHRALVYGCPGCGTTTKAAFPEGVVSAAQYGPRVRAAAVYLNVQQLIPEDRVAATMADLFAAARLCGASVARWCGARARELAPLKARIGALLDHAPVRHLDETGLRVAGKLAWLHVACTPDLTHYRVSPKRGALPATLVRGVVVHDHFKAYYSQMPDLAHALCNAHHLRELKGLIEIEKEPWATKMFRLLLHAARAVRAARTRGETALAEHRVRRIRNLYRAILARGLAFHQAMPPLEKRARGRRAKRIGHNLLVRLRDFEADTLRFLVDFDVPFTNNEAERDIRMTKVKAKISGGFRTIQGADTFATIRSVVSTARKRGWHVLDTLAAPADCLLPRLLA